MNLVEIGQGVVPVSEVDDSGEVGRIAVHGVHGFQRNDFGCRWVVGGEKLLEVIQIIVAPHTTTILITADPGDHGRVIERVAVDQQIRIYLILNASNAASLEP